MDDDKKPLQLKPDEIRFWEAVAVADITDGPGHNKFEDQIDRVAKLADAMVLARRQRMPDQSPPAGAPYRRNLG